MKKTNVAELIVKVLVAALTAFLTALGTTSCMGHGPFNKEASVFWQGLIRNFESASQPRR